MKRSAACLLLVALLYGCYGNASRPLLKKSPYDASFNYYSERLEGKKQKSRHIKKMETAYQLAQKADLLAADSMLNLDKSDRWLYINAYHRRIQSRQKKVLALMPLQSADGYKADFLVVSNINERESASRQASARYLYQQSKDLLSTGRRPDARAAYVTLFNLKENYYAYWENMIALIDSAAQLGVEHVLVESNFSFSPNFIDSKWQKFYRDPSARTAFDVIIRSQSFQVYVGPDDSYTSSYTESKQIEVGYEEKKDSAGNVIERTPIYETISATVTELEVRKTADASIVVEVIDGQTGALIRSDLLATQHVFSESNIKINGDCRALSKSLTPSLFSIFVPTHWEMENKVLDKLGNDFSGFIRSRLWTDN